MIGDGVTSFFVEWMHGYVIKFRCEIIASRGRQAREVRRGGPNKTILWIWVNNLHTKTLRGGVFNKKTIISIGKIFSTELE